MPITQKRMMALIQDFQETRQTMQDLRDGIRQALAGEDTYLREAVESMLGFYPVPKSEALAVEARHFARASRRNDKAAEYMRQLKAHMPRRTESQTASQVGRRFKKHRQDAGDIERDLVSGLDPDAAQPGETGDLE